MSTKSKKQISADLDRLGQLLAQRNQADNNDLVESIWSHENLEEYNRLCAILKAVRESGQVSQEWMDAESRRAYRRYNQMGQ